MTTAAQPQPVPRFEAALCRTRPDLPWLGGGTDRQVRTCVALCCLCPHLIDCGRWAQDNDEPAGIWGGLTQNQREAMSEAMRAPRRPGQAA